MSGWFGYAGGEESPTDAAYSRVTNAERFLPLHTAMLEIIDRLLDDFKVERTEGFGLDEDLERGLVLARPDVKITPRNPDAAPIVVAFTTFPGLHVRFGRWYTEFFPVCGCDACDESAEGEIDRLNDMVDDVTAGRRLRSRRHHSHQWHAVGLRERGVRMPLLPGHGHTDGDERPDCGSNAEHRGQRGARPQRQRQLRV